MLNLLPTTWLRVQKRQWHKSPKADRNGIIVPHQCKLCPRRFKCNVNLTLHVYWHTMNDQKRAQEMNDDPDDPMAVDNSNSEDEDGDTSESELNFLFSPGWIQKFMSLHNVVSVDYEPIEPWINEWLTFLHTEYVIKHHKTLKQVISIILNFDECGFQYKSLPQYSYHGRQEEIRADWFKIKKVIHFNNF